MNIVITIDSQGLEEQLKEMLKDEMAHSEEQIHIVNIFKSKSIPERDELWLLQEREADIKEYFFGDSRMVLSPSTQLVDFDSLTIFKLPESKLPPPPRTPCNALKRTKMELTKTASSRRRVHTGC